MLASSHCVPLMTPARNDAFSGYHIILGRPLPLNPARGGASVVLAAERCATIHVHAKKRYASFVYSEAESRCLRTRHGGRKNERRQRGARKR